jgi:hypothetical protein
MLRFTVIFMLTLFISCTACNGNNTENGNDSKIVPVPDDSHDEEGNDSVHDTDSTVEDDFEPDENIPDEDIDEEWERDIEAPDMSDNPYWEEYSDSDKNIAYYYYGDEPVKASDPEDVKKLWSKMCSYNSC